MVEKKGKLFIVFNPVAGKGKALKAYPKIERFLKDRGVAYEIAHTKGPADALEIARHCSLDADTIVVAAGGDGTCNEIVNGLLTRPEPLAQPPLFGIVPIGRGNDFAFSAHTPSDPLKALTVLLEGKSAPLDVGLVTGGFFPEGRYFVNGVGIGFDTKVGFEAAQMKHIQNALGYALGAIITLARYEPSPLLELRYDDKTLTIPAVLVSIVNGRRMGGVFFMGPNAVLNDGLLDFCTVRRPPSRRRLLQIVFRYLKGTQRECEEVTMGRGVQFQITALEGGMAAHCDGETICVDGKALAIRCIPGALRLIGRDAL